MTEPLGTLPDVKPFHSTVQQKNSFICKRFLDIMHFARGNCTARNSCPPHPCCSVQCGKTFLRLAFTVIKIQKWKKRYPLTYFHHIRGAASVKAALCPLPFTNPDTCPGSPGSAKQGALIAGYLLCAADFHQPILQRTLRF
jgi:hypothetical protein